VANIALEGFLLAGAFVGVWAGQQVPLIGVLAALALGGLLGLLHAFLTQKARLDHLVSGLAINLMAAGVTRFLSMRLFPSGIEVPTLHRAPFLILALCLAALITFVLYRTPFGLRLRAVGENPTSARTSGIDPLPIRYIAVSISGMLAALGGAYISLADVGTFSRDMSAGKGFVALAAVIFGKWKPLETTGGAVLFGFFYALQTQVQISGIRAKLFGIEWASPALLDSLPYVLTTIALVAFVGRAVAPRALGGTAE